MTDAVILHGTKGSPNINWFPWMKEKLEAHGVNVFTPSLPTPQNQSKDNWCSALREQAPDFNEDTILIGHSCGANLVLHILEAMERPVKYAALIGVVIAAIDDDEINKLNETFINHDYQWNEIQSGAQHISIFHGTNDPYVPLSQPQTVAKALNINLQTIENGGHLNAAAGYTEFPKLYNDIIENL